MLQRWRTALCGWLITLASLATPSLANAHPCNNDWIIFILLWMMFHGFTGWPVGNGFPAGPNGCPCVPGGGPAPAPVPPAPNGNGNGHGQGNGNGAMWRAAPAPAMRQGGNAAIRPAPQQQVTRPAAPNLMQLPLRHLLPAQRAMPQMPLHAAKPAKNNGGKPGNAQILPGNRLPAVAAKPMPGKPKLPEAQKPMMGGKPLIGAKPAGKR
ncbi:MAG: hypothetical protein RMI91_14750 [Gemmatales bacterium]|nr:hypothetical protein [Gemmatales bacterium]MDW7995904.1 hypothetical protein [Gemmatales bacterium]